MPHSCVVLHAHHKAAGVTLISVLKEWMSAAYDPHTLHRQLSVPPIQNQRDTWACDDLMGQWSYQDETCPNAKLKRPWPVPRLLTNGLVLPLALEPAWRQPTCLWIAVFREPLARLASALSYCKSPAAKKGRGDPLCGHSRLSIDGRTTMAAFARHWGNYLFRELLMHPELRPAHASLKLSALKPSLAASAGGVSSANLTLWQDPLWWVWRQQLRGADDPTTTDGQRHLVHVQRRLIGTTLPLARGAAAGAATDGDARATGRLYDVVGVVERWHETCALLDAALPFPPGVLNAANQTRSSFAFESAEHRERHGSGRWARDEHAALDAARHDPSVRALLAADLEIFEHAVLPVFEQQLRMLLTDPTGYRQSVRLT